ncbi:MAG: dephospho-CoA kinase [Anaerolineae bacterium]|jgi:dephospho-CoA kinase|nr:dephospho-CoA kinase [Anaerolineae bacterium]
MKPFVIGLTGSIGCGKSHVLETLVKLGAEGIDADKVAHEVMAPGAAAYEQIVAAFGPEILGESGAVDRVQLAARVFRDPAALARLEAIVHPAVYAETKRRVETSAAPAVAIEAIKLLEAGLSVGLCDEVWVVVCSEAEQLARLARSRGMSPEEVRRRRANQMAPELMAERADRIIRSDGTLEETENEVLRLWVALGLPLPTAPLGD